MAWGDLFQARRDEMLGGGSGHVCVVYFDARDAYRWAVSSANTDQDLVIEAARHLALSSRALLGMGEPFLRDQLDFDDARVAQLRRWAAGSEAQLAAAVDAARAENRPINAGRLRRAAECTT